MIDFPIESYNMFHGHLVSVNLLNNFILISDTEFTENVGKFKYV